MKLVTFDEGRVGYVDGETRRRARLRARRGSSSSAASAVPETGERLALADVRLRAPIVPKKFFHTAGNFAAHHEELQAVDWSHPVHKGIVFFQNVDAIIGPDDDIVYPEGLTKELDYELELAVVIGRSGKFFGPDEAASYIAGYTVFNDITARDIQRREMESGVFSFSKAIDTFCPIGPWIVTADEIDGPARAGDGAAGQRRGAAVRQHLRPADSAAAARRAPLAAGVLRRRPDHHRHHLRGRGGPAEPVRLLPAARRRRRGVDRGRRDAAQPGGPVERRRTTPSRTRQTCTHEARDPARPRRTHRRRPGARRRAVGPQPARQPAHAVEGQRGRRPAVRGCRAVAARPGPAPGLRDRPQLRAARGRGRLHGARPAAGVHQVRVLPHRAGLDGHAAARRPHRLGDRGRGGRRAAVAATSRSRRRGRRWPESRSARTSRSACCSSPAGPRSSRSASRTPASARSVRGSSLPTSWPTRTTSPSRRRSTALRSSPAAPPT